MTATGSWTVTRVEVDLETVTGLRVGAERDTGVGTDLPLLRLPDGRPYVPGSSVKGVLRASTERLLAGVGIRVCDPLDPRARCGADREDSPWERLCTVCRLFGSPSWAGRIRCGDLVPDGPVTTVVRDGVGIDRGELKASDRLKYDYEVVPPGVSFGGEIRIEDRLPGELGLVLTLIELVDAGVISIGGGTTRGLGRLRLRSPARVSELDAATFRPGDGWRTVDVDGAADELARQLEQWRSADPAPETGS